MFYASNLSIILFFASLDASWGQCECFEAWPAVGLPAACGNYLLNLCIANSTLTHCWYFKDMGYLPEESSDGQRRLEDMSADEIKTIEGIEFGLQRRISAFGNGSRGPQRSQGKRFLEDEGEEDAPESSCPNTGSTDPRNGPTCDPMTDFAPSLADAGQYCGMLYFTVDNFLLIHGGASQPLSWNIEQVAAFLLMNGAPFLGMNTKTNPDMATLAYYADVDGKRFMSLTIDDMIRLGYTDGNARTFVKGRDDHFATFSWPPSDISHQEEGVANAERFVDKQFDISITFILEKFHGLDEIEFEFEVEFMVILSWEDPRIFARCDDAGIDGFDEGDPCAMFWQPELMWPNLVMIDDPDATLEPVVIEDHGFKTRVGESVIALNDNNSPGLETSFGSRSYSVRGKFMAELSFLAFPKDKQELNVTALLPGLPFRKAKFVSRADAQPTSDDAPPLWQVDCVSSSVGIKDTSDRGSSFMAATDDSYANYIRSVSNSNMDPVEIQEELFPAFDMRMKDASTDEKKELRDQYTKYSTVTMIIQISRLPQFYTYNFVLIVILLTLVSFFSFFIPKSSLDARLGLTLTVVLGLNVFQIVVIDNTPATGYLTRMHDFLIFSTELVIIVALENLIVYGANLRAEALKEKKASKRNSMGKGRDSGGEGLEMKNIEGGISIANPMQVQEGRSPDLPCLDEEETKKERASCMCIFDPLILFVDAHLDTISAFAFPAVFATLYVMKFENGASNGINDRCNA